MPFVSFGRMFRAAVALVSLVAASVLPNVGFAQGTITFSVPTLHLSESSSPQTGTFDVAVSETGATDTLWGFAVDLYAMSGAGGVLFSNAGYSTTIPYVFAGNSGAQINGAQPFIGLDSTPGDSNTATQVFPTGDHAGIANEIYSSDFANAGAGTVLGTTPLGLLQVEYSVPANFVGSVDLTLNQSSNAFADYVQLSPDVTYTFQPSADNGSINVGSQSDPLAISFSPGFIFVTPEPSTWLLAIFGAAGMWLLRRRGGR